MKVSFVTVWLAASCAALSVAEDAPELKELIIEAEHGDAEAQHSLAVRYRDGHGVDRDYTEAMRWGHRAADQGNPAALDFVGWMYFTGTGVPRNSVLAAGYFKASSRGCAAGAWNLGQCYFAAQGVEQDVPQALVEWKRAAAVGHGRAASTAAMVYLSGEGVPADRDEALRLAELAVELDDPSGLVVLGEICFQDGDLDRARELWTKVSRMRPTHPTSQPEQPSDQLAAQQGADLLRLMEYRTRPAEPGKFVVLPVEHLHQGWNNCGATSCAMFARAQGKEIDGWDFKKLCPSPLGTGTDWGDLVEASASIGLHWKLITFTPDDAGFVEATDFARRELDAGRPLVIDFKYIGPRYPNGEAGHTLTIVGYLAAENIYVLCNPALPTPGLQLISAEDLKKYWRSDHYSRLSNNVLSRPVIVIDMERP
ncbi:MAG: SEL1-like repeat protein [Planctomycetaceae bacterium]|nr:SEL1-like repeat protein [Planctomycetaceae bacterium]